MTNRVRIGLSAPAALLLLIASPVAAQSGMDPLENGETAPDSPVSFEVAAGGMFQFKSDMDRGGSFEATRFSADLRARWKLENDTSLLFRLGYGIDDYEFSGTGGSLAGLNPWEDIHTVALSVLYEADLGNDWEFFGGPRISSSRESGADFSDSLEGGGVAGLAWQVDPALKLGLGIGVISQMEDDVRVFPAAIVDWRINQNWRLSSQGGTVVGGISGLELTCRIGQGWEAGAGASYRRGRFRLDDDPAGAAPGGVGEETAIPLWLRAGWTDEARRTEIGGFVGLATVTELDLEDLNGNQIRRDEGDGAFFAGLYGRIRF